MVKHEWRGMNGEVTQFLTDFRQAKVERGVRCRLGDDNDRSRTKLRSNEVIERQGPHLTYR